MAWDIFWHRMLRRPYRLVKVVDQGSGPVNIVLIHGLASRSAIWNPLIKILDPAKYRVRSYDLLGFGVSPKPGYSKYSTKEHAKTMMHSLSKEFTGGEQFIFIGHSMGCIIATQIAHKWPKRTKSLILYKPPLLEDNERRSFHKKFYNYLASKPATLALYAKFANRIFAGKLGGFKTEDEQWLPIESSLYNTILAQQTIEQLKQLDMPTHIIYGRLDLFVSKIKAKKLAGINPDLQLHYVTEMHDIKPKSSRYIKNLIERL